MGKGSVCRAGRTITKVSKVDKLKRAVGENWLSFQADLVNLKEVQQTFHLKFCLRIFLLALGAV